MVLIKKIVHGIAKGVTLEKERKTRVYKEIRRETDPSRAERS
jgi:hypothetical protein